MENSAVCAEHMEPHKIEANVTQKKSQKSIASSRDVTVTKSSPSSNAITNARKSLEKNIKFKHYMVQDVIVPFYFILERGLVLDLFTFV